MELLPDEDLRRVLCVVAHPDDLEYGVSAAVASWVARGVEVSYLLLTSGEAGMQRDPAETGPLRAQEQARACAEVGVTDLTILDHPDGHLEPSLELRRDIARHIRRVRPDAVVTMTWADVVPWGLSMADHRVAGLAAADAVRDADNRWVFRELAEQEGLEPWGATWLLVSGSDEPTHAVDVSGEPLERGIASLEQHREYLADLPGHPAPRELITGVTAEAGRELGVEAAEAFRAFRLR
ncbi:PIG-L family deacetylase [Kocuria palustris]|jgi:LmbE family N-acetylglucosaminyl deacetylase|uniref:PIG-L deacetylase family protein n=1 Tax=Kocuria palustris TaxID=71999 RepID=UPI00045E8415|nr:PIG-L deacetylase family protein [Kocuria palustris]MDN5572940.1 PIG-L family deacetylase [Micrococcales bacterium]ALB03794.1 GlcNAc-PI de-N-acetylase [Kocuria palustris]KUG54172.1 GlcNAc-PI de-N-acetylase [Kocuria palustris]MBM7822622.1 LmbE family N-acetylglucosaminyl deacetylase [Kocuria palustris]MBN6753609.1 PIG-L family deacetylase [Kocuria palustris]